jgi:hypothetical protein
MRAIFLGLLMVSAPAVANVPPPSESFGVAYTNEEEVYFKKEAKQPAPPWLSARVDDVTGGFRFVDAYSRDVVAPKGAWLKTDSTATRQFRFADGTITTLRRARPVTCWGSVPKTTKKPDGTDDWYFIRGIKLHDQGGRVQFGGGDTGAPPVVIRMRNVIWPSGPSQPSLVLYVHKPETPDHAESYSWADPGAKRIGINLRWMQASCTID